jgi:hypothetical protein
MTIMLVHERLSSFGHIMAMMSEQSSLVLGKNSLYILFIYFYICLTFLQTVAAKYSHGHVSLPLIDPSKMTDVKLDSIQLTN